MSNQIKTKLKTIDENLDKIKKEVLEGKRKIAYALKENGYTQVNPYDDNSSIYDTFAKYAELILRLRNKNSMILEFTIPETAQTLYKKTVVLPMVFGSDGCPTTSLNAIAQEVIAINRLTVESTTPKASAPRRARALKTTTANDVEEYIIKDVLGNDCIDGEYLIDITEINQLDASQRDEFINAAAELGYTVEDDESNSTVAPRRAAARARAVVDPKNNDAVYDYTVDWGDGSSATYVDGGSYETNKNAIWHTYENGGVYNVSINGNFRRLRTQGHWNGNFVQNGEFVRDVDGETLTDTFNYGMIKYLTNVIAWGNTLLIDCNSGLRYTQNLESVPMYDTTNSFADVSDFSYMFAYSGLKSIPYNANTKKGLFSNCTKATNMYYLFASCSRLSGALPEKLIDGCINVTNLGNIFGYCPKLTGSFPEGFLSGLKSVTNASEMFAGDTGLNGELPENLFSDCPNITTINRIFYNCSGLKGTIGKGFIAGLSRLTDVSQAFWNCTNITGIDKDAFSGLTADGINFREAFYGCGFTELPAGLFSQLTGKNHLMERMFSDCANLTKIGENDLMSLRPAAARGMFGSCTSLNCNLTEIDDWKSYRTIKKWYGAFAGAANLTIGGQACPFELNALGNRKFAEGNVGKIVLQDETLVEPKDFAYNTANKPTGIVFADVYIDPAKTSAMIAHGQGNVVEDGTAGSVHKVLASVLNDNGTYYTDLQTHIENNPFINDTWDVNVSYDRLIYSPDGVTQTLPQLRYCGEEYDRAIAQLCVEKGYADNMTGGTYTSYEYNESADTIVTTDMTKLYFKRDADFENTHKYVAYANAVRKEEYDITLNRVKSSRYPAMTMCHSYTNGLEEGTCYLPDASELWDQACLITFFFHIMKVIIERSADHTSNNTYPLRLGTYYWASPEVSETDAWDCRTDYMYVGNWNGKWGWYYVRAAFALLLNA